MHRELQMQARNKSNIQFKLVKVTHHHIDGSWVFHIPLTSTVAEYAIISFCLFLYSWKECISEIHGDVNPPSLVLFFLQKTFYLPTPPALTRPHSFYSQHLLMQTKSLVCLPQPAHLAFSLSGICIQQGDVPSSAVFLSPKLQWLRSSEKS